MDPDVDPVMSVIVPVKNGAETIQRCLEALKRQDARFLYEILVIDNGSTDGTQAIVTDEPGVTLLHEPTPGSYAARNLGLAVAKGRVIAFTDADCIPRADWLSSALANIPDDGFIVGAIEVRRTNGRPSPWECWELVHAFPQEMYWREHQFGATANVVATKAAFVQAGVFKADLVSGGDREWCQRAVRSGVAGRFCAAAVVEHPPRTTWSEMYAKVRRVTRGTIGVRRASGRALVVAKDFYPPGRSVVSGVRSPRLPDLRARLMYVGAVGALYLAEAVSLIRAASEGSSRGRTLRSHRSST